MDLILTVLVVTTGFSIISYLYLKHIAKLEMLLKAENLADFTYSQKPEPTATKLEDAYSEDIQEVFSNHTNAEVIEAFKKQNGN